MLDLVGCTASGAGPAALIYKNRILQKPHESTENGYHYHNQSRILKSCHVDFYYYGTKADFITDSTRLSITAKRSQRNYWRMRQGQVDFVDSKNCHADAAGRQGQIYGSMGANIKIQNDYYRRQRHKGHVSVQWTNALGLRRIAISAVRWCVTSTVSPQSVLPSVLLKKLALSRRRDAADATCGSAVTVSERSSEVKFLIRTHLQTQLYFFCIDDLSELFWALVRLTSTEGFEASTTTTSQGGRGLWISVSLFLRPCSSIVTTPTSQRQP